MGLGVSVAPGVREVGGSGWGRVSEEGGCKELSLLAGRYVSSDVDFDGICT